MIEANSYHLQNVLVLEINIPGTDQKEFKSITGPTAAQRESDAYNLILFKNKSYILKKLSSWVKQRSFAVKEPKLRVGAAQLRVLLNYHTHKDFYKVCQFVVKHEYLIESLAPRLNTSSHYPYYYNTIAPIVAFCKTIVCERSDLKSD